MMMMIEEHHACSYAFNRGCCCSFQSWPSLLTTVLSRRATQKDWAPPSVLLMLPRDAEFNLAEALANAVALCQD